MGIFFNVCVFTAINFPFSMLSLNSVSLGMWSFQIFTHLKVFSNFLYDFFLDPSVI